MVTPRRRKGSALRSWSQRIWRGWIESIGLERSAIAALAYGTKSVPKVDKIVDQEINMWLRPKDASMARSTSIWWLDERDCDRLG